MRTLYVSDLDGTLLRSDQRISSYSASVINRLVDEGMLFSYATARSIITARRATQGLNARIPLILYNGAFTMDSATGEILIGNLFEKEEFADILNDLMSGGVRPIVYGLHAGKEQFRYLKAEINRETRGFVDSRKGDPRDMPVERKDQLSQGQPFYITCIDRAERLSAYYERYRTRCHCVYHKDIYTGDQWLEIMPGSASKARAAVQLKEYLKCERLIAFGDGLNDMDLFEAADECYAVSNAAVALRERATAVIGGNDEDSVARWLEERFHGEQDRSTDGKGRDGICQPGNQTGDASS